MRRIVVYSHDTFGLGNIRRMLAISKQLVDTLPDVSVLLITGSPVVHSFRLPQRLDYIKLPSLSRTDSDDYTAKYLATAIDETIMLRSSLILQAVISFQPDLILVDKKPLGVKHELQAALAWARAHLPATKNVLILRDILDTPATTIAVWKKHDYHAAIEAFYELVLVLGTPEIFDPVREYAFPAAVADKVRFVGYTRRDGAQLSSSTIRQQLGLQAGEALILTTPGGGQDGAALLKAFVASIDGVVAQQPARSLIVTGPELPDADRSVLHRAVAHTQHVSIVEFTDDLLSYMAAADLLVSMGGYNTVCEILSVGKPAVVVPRARPVQEQVMRAGRMAELGLFQMLHPDELTPQRLTQSILRGLEQHHTPPEALTPVDLGALPRITATVAALLANDTAATGHEQAAEGVPAVPQRRQDWLSRFVRQLAPSRSQW